MCRFNYLLLVMLGLVAPPVLAQFTAPVGLANKEGVTRFHVPQYNPSRFQTIYGAAAMPTGLSLIKTLKLRADGSVAAPMVGHTYEHTVRLSNQNKDPLYGYGIRWSGNHGADMAVVVNKKKVTWPATVMPATGPSVYFVTFVLDKPFTYKGKAFVLDIAVHGPASSIYSNFWYVDSELGNGFMAVDYGRAARTGKGCPHDANVQANRFVINGYYPHLNGPFYLFGDSQAKGKTLSGFCLYGEAQSKYMTFPLPMSFGPFGAYGCHLYTDIKGIRSAFTDPTSLRGRITFDIGTVPSNPNLVGRKVSTQLIVLDPSYNTMGVRATDLMTWTVGGGFSGQLDGYSFYAYQSSPTSPLVDPKFCTYSNNFMPIVQFF